MALLEDLPVENGTIYVTKEQFKEFVYHPHRVKLMRAIREEDEVQKILKDQMAGRKPVTYFNAQVVAR